ncbi:SRPBCC family protein [Mucilaginibacter segetis]|uniref:SRPBCC domain-containing protein n=1 Tax=Mucilaginibacter segetis TaxID=2793071 RepID=A0A934PXA7_9SPHI|nr:SRPBCC domain-containing protein [Mucilaginibacter segetis]MBK0380801.1 SRPBCC domain-containing protein [Mucilaginibacter segetis]
MNTKETVFTKDEQNKKLIVVRAFDAPQEQVWKAWTDSAILDQWWAPKPYRAETKTMDFRTCGHWLYFMIGPQGDTTLCRVNFVTVEDQKGFSTETFFCDAQGNENPDLPKMYWDTRFSQSGKVTTVNIEISFDNLEDMEAIIKMGFKEGFTMGLGNLDEYLANNG